MGEGRERGGEGEAGRESGGLRRGEREEGLEGEEPKLQTVQHQLHIIQH